MKIMTAILSLVLISSTVFAGESDCELVRAMTGHSNMKNKISQLEDVVANSANETEATQAAGKFLELISKNGLIQACLIAPNLTLSYRDKVLNCYSQVPQNFMSETCK